MKDAYCQFCRKPLGKVPNDATDITCFKCDQARELSFDFSPPTNADEQADQDAYREEQGT